MPWPSGATVIAIAAGTVASASLAHRLCSALPLRLRLTVSLALAPKSRGVLICNASVPLSLLCRAERNEAQDWMPDDEGLVAVDTHIVDGLIAGVWAANHSPSLKGAWRVSAEESILMQCFTDAHVHLIKTQAGPRCRNSTGSINGALDAEVDDKERWVTTGDISRRMDFSLRCAWHYGSSAMRTHLDGSDFMSPPELRAAVFNEFDNARKKWAPRGLLLQGVANLFLPFWLMDEAAAHADEAASHAGVVLGAYCGDTSGKDPTEVQAAFQALLRHAHRLGLDVDLHIDETNNPACCAVADLCTSLRKARNMGYEGRVVLSHVTSLSLQPDRMRNHVLRELSQLQPVTVICCPNTNLYLQDRRGTEPPIGIQIPAAEARTPTWRGITLVQELADRGIPVAISSDNVRDWWFPFGDYDCVSLLTLALSLGHLDTAPSPGNWAHAICCTPAAAMGLQKSSCCGLVRGAPADLVLFPCTRRASELLARPQLSERVVVRAGAVQFSRLPRFSQLDDLVQEKTRRSVQQQPVQRGASSAASASAAADSVIADCL